LKQLPKLELCGLNLPKNSFELPCFCPEARVLICKLASGEKGAGSRESGVERYLSTDFVGSIGIVPPDFFSIAFYPKSIDFISEELTNAVSLRVSS
jgi:hypothetical protein